MNARAPASLELPVERPDASLGVLAPEEEGEAPRSSPAAGLWLLLGLALPLTALVSLGVGAYRIPPLEVLALLLARLGLDTGAELGGQADLVLTAVRLPRVVGGLLVGAALGVAGALMQGIFRNPLAEPGLVGVSAGGMVGAATAIVLLGEAVTAMPVAVGAWVVPACAFLGSLAATLLALSLGRRRGGGTDVVTLLLAGVAISAVGGAWTGLLIYLADDVQLRSVTFWSMGALGGLSWQRLGPLVVGTLPLLVAAPFLARALDALLLGEREAAHLGVDPDRVQHRVVVLVALAVGTAVALTGTIGFVGLVVPHLVRLVLGPGHRRLLPAAALLGAVLLTAADLVARTVVAPAELPIGLLTTLLGGPFLVWLLRRGAARGAP